MFLKSVSNEVWQQENVTGVVRAGREHKYIHPSLEREINEV